MRAPSDAIGDVLLALFAVAVLAGAGITIAGQHDAPVVATVTAGAAGPSTSAPAVVATHPPTRPPANPTGPVVVAGPDLAKLRAALVADTGASVVVADGNGPDVLAAHALDGIGPTPRAVVLQVLAGSRTSVRTTQALTAVQDHWPAVRVLVIGPFSSADRKSAAAVQHAAKFAGVTFLDPVALHWRPRDSSAVLSSHDLALVAATLAQALK